VPLRAAMEKNTARGIAGALRGMAIRPDRRNDLARIAFPLSSLSVRRMSSPPRRSPGPRRRDSQRTARVVPEAGHMAPFENAAVANAVILRFL